MRLTPSGAMRANARRVTRYKTDAPSFAGLCVALEDADARVRIKDHVPQSVSKILGVHMDGGFLSGQAVQFSPNLNCIIGERGTGKSTTFEAARCIIGSPAENKVVDSEVWPDAAISSGRIKLVSNTLCFERGMVNSKTLTTQILGRLLKQPSERSHNA